MPEILQNMQKGRHSEFKRLVGVKAATIFYRVEILPEELVVKRSGLALVTRQVPKSFYPENFNTKEFTSKVHEKISKTVLARACGRVLRYPKSYLQGKNIAEIVALLHALFKFRTISHHGTRAVPKKHFRGPS